MHLYNTQDILDTKDTDWKGREGKVTGEREKKESPLRWLFPLHPSPGVGVVVGTAGMLRLSWLSPALCRVQ